jgi:hypothetical protein
MEEKFIKGLGLEIRATEPDKSVRLIFDYNIKVYSKEVE